MGKLSIAVVMHGYTILYKARKYSVIETAWRMHASINELIVDSDIRLSTTRHEAITWINDEYLSFEHNEVL